MSSEQLDGIRKCLCRSGSRSQPRQGPKPGRKRRWRGFPGAPSGAGRGVSPRIPRIGAELGAWSRLRPADAVRGRRGRGYIVACGSSFFLTGRRYENSVLFEDISLWGGLKRRSTEYSVHFSTISSFCGLHSLCFFSGIVPQPYATIIINKSSIL